MYRLYKLKGGFVVVSDEEIIIGDKRLDFYSNGLPANIREVTDIIKVDGHNDKIIDYGPYNLRSSVVKVIAQQDQITFSEDIPEDKLKEIGWFDVEKYWLEDTKTISFGETNKNDHFNNYQKGFQKAQELTDRMFTLEDIKQLMAWSALMAEGKRSSGLSITNITEELENKFKFLSQPKSWEVELEMEQTQSVISGGLRPLDEIGGKGLTRHVTLQPKFTNGKVKIIKLL
jgi:hypothetical protein